MAWKFDNILYSMTDDVQNEKAKQVWEGESLGGITENNNRLPVAVVWLLCLTILTAFLVTAPLWGQRPQAIIYEDYIAMMETPQVNALASDVDKMAFIVKTVKAKATEWEALQDRHPLDMDDLRMIKDQVIALQQAKVNLAEYTVIGNKVVLANFEGNLKADGTKERLQPWWDKGYTIDVFYVIYFCIAVLIAVKRLPSYKYEPKHMH